MSPADLYGGSGLDLGFEAGFGEDPALLSAQARAKALRRARVGRGSQTDTAGTSTSLSAAPSAPAAFAAPTQPSQPGQRPVGQRDFTGERSQIEGELTKANAPEDYSALSQYARDRDRQGHRSLILALAAQQAGDEFAPLATHFARAAEANRTPLKVTGGMLDSGGKFLADPAYQQEQRRATLEKRLDSLNASEQSAGQFTLQQARLAEEAKARQAATEESAAQRAQFHEDSLAGQRQNRDIREDDIAYRRSRRHLTADPATGGFMVTDDQGNIVGNLPPGATTGGGTYDILPKMAHPKEHEHYAQAAQTLQYVPGLIDQVKANPKAFGLIAGAGGSFQNAYGVPVQDWLSRLTPEQKALRGQVYREAYETIKDLAGTAMSVNEGTRIMQFAPGPYDDGIAIMSKLQGGINYAKAQRAGLRQRYGMPGEGGAPSAQPGASAQPGTQGKPARVTPPPGWGPVQRVR